jgi:hypothetical protein
LLGLAADAFRRAAGQTACRATWRSAS